MSGDGNELRRAVLTRLSPASSITTAISGLFPVSAIATAFRNQAGAGVVTVSLRALSKAAVWAIGFGSVVLTMPGVGSLGFCARSSPNTVGRTVSSAFAAGVVSIGAELAASSSASVHNPITTPKPSPSAITIRLVATDLKARDFCAFRSSGWLLGGDAASTNGGDDSLGGNGDCGVGRRRALGFRRLIFRGRT